MLKITKCLQNCGKVVIYSSISSLKHDYQNVLSQLMKYNNLGNWEINIIVNISVHFGDFE